MVVDKEYHPGKPVIVVKLPGTNPELPSGSYLINLGTFSIQSFLFSCLMFSQKLLLLTYHNLSDDIFKGSESS